jgi:ketosteroid isomerase-like protein
LKETAMHPNAELIQRFYAAFNQKDGAAMSLCYAREAVFEDPAFGELKGAQIGAMWRMLCSRAADLQVVASDIQADEVRGSAHWEADYTFSQTNRLVHNVIDARFVFANGLIVEHRDHFDFWRWSRQALGMPGLLLGWSGFLNDKVRRQARANLERYMESAARP